MGSPLLSDVDLMGWLFTTVTIALVAVYGWRNR